MSVTLFDILMMGGLVAGAAWGFGRGLFRQAAGVLVIYLATIISTLAYRGLGNLIGRGNPSPPIYLLAFLILMVVMNLLLSLIFNDLLKTLDERRFGTWANIGGMIFGFINAGIWCTVLMIITRAACGGDPWVGYQGFQQFLQRQTYGSVMSFVLSPFMRLLLLLVQPWLFGHSLPPLLLYAL